MEYTLFESTWPILLFSIVGVLFEICSVKDKGINSIIFLFSSVGIIVFSATHVSLCSDYGSYQQVFASRQNLQTLDVGNLIQVDGLYTTLAGVWSLSIGKLLTVSGISSFHLFTAYYQTATIVILIITIYFFYPRWKNMLLFMILFGSLQFQHIILCGIRHGLSSSLVSLTFISFHKVFASEEKKPNWVVLVCLALIAMFAHWQAIIILLLFMFFWLIRSAKRLTGFSIPKIFRSRFTLVLILPYICLLVYLSYQLIISYLILPLSSNLLSSQYSRIELYVSGGWSGYGTRIALTSYLDIMLIYLSFRIIQRIRNIDKILVHFPFSRIQKILKKDVLYLNSKNELYLEENKDCKINKLNFSDDDNLFLIWIIYFSVLNLFTKIIVYAGVGVLIRVSVSIHLLQILCLPFLLKNLGIRTRLFLFLLSSAPYVYFVLFVAGDKILRFV